MSQIINKCISVIENVEIIDDGKTCRLSLSCKSLSYKNSATMSSQHLISLVDVTKYKLWVGNRFHSTFIYEKGSYLDKLVNVKHDFETAVTKEDQKKAHKLQLSI